MKSKKPNKMTLHLSQVTTIGTERSKGRPGAVKINGSKSLCSQVENAHQGAKPKEVYAAIKKITKSATTKMQSVKRKTGTILTEPSDVRERWKANSQELYNEHNPTNEIAATSLPINSSSDPEPNTLKEEIESAIRKLSEEKAPRFDSVSSEETKQQGEQEWIFPLSQKSNLGNRAIPLGLG